MKVNFFYEVRWIGEKKTTRNIVIILENRVHFSLFLTSIVALQLMSSSTFVVKGCTFNEGAINRSRGVFLQERDRMGPIPNC